MTKSLTKRQRELINELGQIVELTGWDYSNNAQAIDNNCARTAYLEMVKRQLIAANVVQQYVLCDEFLNLAISRYYFGTVQRRRSRRQHRHGPAPLLH
jgi:hypothetical protein